MNMIIDESKQRFFPKYRDVKFKGKTGKTQFGRWLSATAKYKIEFEDKGQDCLAWYIDEGGEVLHSEPFQASVWNGKMVDFFNLEVGKDIGVLVPEKKATQFYDFVVKKITKVTNKKK